MNESARKLSETKKETQSTDYRKVGFWQLLVLVLLLNFVVQAIHEGGHWIVYETAGRGPVWGFIGLVQSWDEPPLHPNEWIERIAPDGARGWERFASAPSKTEDILGLIAGPLASLLGVVLGLSLMRFNRNPTLKQMGLVLALITSFIMSQYYLRGFSRTGGDEYFLAGLLGIPKYIIDIPFCVAFITGFILGIWSLGNWQTRLKWLGTILLGSLPAGIFLVIADGIVRSQANQDNALFQPLLGVSLPVIAINVVVVLALWTWWKQANKSIMIQY